MKAELLSVSNGKCPYCETRIAGSFDGDIEMFRPKSVYWWLAYEWDNLFMSCQTCNRRYKKDRFPVLKKWPLKEITDKSVAELNQMELPLLLDPCVDDPTEHFRYVANRKKQEVSLFSLTERADATIETLGLNRIELKQNRYVVFMQMDNHLRIHKESSNLPGSKQEPKKKKGDKDLFSELNVVQLTSMVAIREMIHSGSEYAAMTRQQLAEYISAYPDCEYLLTVDLTADEINKIKELKYDPEKKETGGIVIKKFLPVEVEIKNFKSIDHLKFHFRTLEENTAYAKVKGTPDEVKESWIMLLGENGIGKSSVLAAIILALLPDQQRTNFIGRPKDLVKKGNKEGFIRITLDDGAVVALTFDDTGAIEGNISSFEDFLLAYGATRLLPKGKLEPETKATKIKVGNFFDYSIALNDAKKWLLDLSDSDFDHAALFLKDLLFLKDNLYRNNGEIFTTEYGEEMEIGMLSDGYKTLLGLAVDMLKTFATQETDERYIDIGQHASGVVLIDEIGTHLHPRWKMQIVERFRAALPNVFFIVTSHEPLCLRGLRDKEIVVLQRDKNTEGTISIPNLPSIEGLRIDQVLTSKFFGLNSTIDPLLETKFDRYYDLLSVPESERSETNKDEIDDLQADLKKFNQLGDSPREELFYYIIDQVIAKNIKENGMKTKEELKSEVRTKIEGLLANIDSNAWE